MVTSDNQNTGRGYSADGVERILIVRPSALGDVARSVPVLVTLRECYPNARIDWLVNEGFEDVLRHHPGLDCVIPFARKRYSTAFRNWGATRDAVGWASQLRGRRYDLVIDLQGLLRSGLITWLTRAKRRIGFANAQEMGWLGYNEKYALDRGLHTVDRMVGLAKAAGLGAGYDLRLYVGEDDRTWWREVSVKEGWGEGGYVCMAPTAKWLCKCWPIEKYVEVGKRIVEQGICGGRVVLLAGPSEGELVQPVVDALGGKVLFPRTKVGQMMAVLEGAGLLVCNDSAPLHIAVGLGRPVVTVFGPTNPGLVGPFGEAYKDSVVRPEAVGELSISDYRKQRDDQGLIDGVGVEEVWERIGSVLGEK